LNELEGIYIIILWREESISIIRSKFTVVFNIISLVIQLFHGLLLTTEATERERWKFRSE
jgi:hypothetical protein